MGEGWVREKLRRGFRGFLSCLGDTEVSERSFITLQVDRVVPGTWWVIRIGEDTRYIVVRWAISKENHNLELTVCHGV